MTTDSWTFGGSGYWTTAADWSEGHAPLTGEDVVIDVTNSGSYFFDVNMRTTASINTLTVGGNSELDIGYSSGGSELTVEGAASFTNLLTIDYGTLNLLGSTSYAYAGISMDGTLNVESGTLFLSGQSVTSYPYYYFQGKVTGSGTLAFVGGTLDLAHVTLGVASFTVSGAGATLEDTNSYGGHYGGVFSLNDGATFILDLRNAFPEMVFRLGGATSLVDATVTGSGTLATSATVTVSGLTIGGNLAWTDGGQATQSGDDVVIGDTSGDTATLTVAAGGSYLIADDTGIDTHAAALIDNTGAFGKTGGTGTSVISVGIHDSGTIENSAAGGALEFDGARNVFGGIFTGPGEITLAADDISNLNALAFTGAASLANFGVVNAADDITLDEGSSIVNESGAYWSLAGDVGLIAAASASDPLFTNEGNLTKSSGAGTSVVAIDFDDSSGGVVTIATGTVAFDGPDNNFAGLVAGKGVLEFGGGVSTIEAGARFTVASLSAAGAGAQLVLDTDLFYANAFTLGDGATLDLNGSYLVLTGASDFAGGAVDGTSTLYTRGSSDISGLIVGGAVKWVNSGAATQAGGDVTIGDSSAVAASLTNTATGVYDITDDSGIALGTSSSSLIVNAGLMEKSGGTGTSLIAPDIFNTGVILADRGVLDIEGALSGTGGVEIGPLSTLVLGGSVQGAQTLAFYGLGGEILLDDLQSGGKQIFHGVISGFGADEKIGIGAATFVGFTENSGNTSGTLALLDGTASASITLIGDYTSANFTASIVGGETTLSYKVA